MDAISEKAITDAKHTIDSIKESVSDVSNRMYNNEPSSRLFRNAISELTKLQKRLNGVNDKARQQRVSITGDDYFPIYQEIIIISREIDDLLSDASRRQSAYIMDINTHQVGAPKISEMFKTKMMDVVHASKTSWLMILLFIILVVACIVFALLGNKGKIDQLLGWTLSFFSGFVALSVALGAYKQGKRRY